MVAPTVYAGCEHAIGFRIYQDNKCMAFNCGQHSCYAPCHTITIYGEHDHNIIDKSNTITGDWSLRNEAPVGQWDLVWNKPQKNSMSVLAAADRGCNVGGMGCDWKKVKVTKSKWWQFGISTEYVDCGDVPPVPK